MSPGKLEGSFDCQAPINTPLGSPWKYLQRWKSSPTANFSGRWKPQKVWMSWVQSGSRGLQEWDTVVIDQNIYRKQLLMLLKVAGGTEKVGRFVKPRRLKVRTAKLGARALPALLMTRSLNKAPHFPNVDTAVCPFENAGLAFPAFTNVDTAVCPYSLMAWCSPHHWSLKALHLSQACPAHGDSSLECFWCSSLL